jgi:hypothetical protein
MNVMSYTKLAAVAAVTVCFVGGLGACSSTSAPKSPSGKASTASRTAPSSLATASASSSNGAEGAQHAAGSDCRIVADIAVVNAFAGAIGPNTASYDTNSQRCKFTLVTSNVGRGVVVTLSRHQSVTKETFVAAKASAVAVGAESVAGIGDDAYFSPDSANLQFISGGAASALQVQAGAAGGVPGNLALAKADLVALAKAIIAAG